MADWTPANISSDILALWLDADDASTITESGGSVSQWDDKSGNNHHVSQATVSLQPALSAAAQNGKDAISFSSDRLATSGNFPVSGDAAFSIFVAYKKGATAGAGSVLGWGFTGAAATAAGLYDDNSLVAWAFAGARNYNINTLSVSSAKILAYTKSPGPINTSSGAWKNGTVDGTSGHSSSTPNISLLPFVVGRWADITFGSDLIGDVFEIIVLSKEATEDERETIEGYLAHKWGIEADLPGGHPYKSAAPTVGAEIALATETETALSITPQIIVGVPVEQASETETALPMTRLDVVKTAVETEQALDITPLYPPRFTDPAPVSGNAGDVVQFAVTDLDSPAGAGTVTYQWYDQGGLIQFATASTYNRELSPDDDGEDVYVIVSNDVGSTTSADAGMTVATTDDGVDDIEPITYTLRLGRYREPFYKNGTVILSRPLKEGEYLSIERKTPITKDISFTTSEEPDWNAFEYQVDKYMMICQEIEGHICECLECIVPVVNLTFEITELPPGETEGELVVSPNVPTTAPANSTVTFTANVIAGTPPFTYAWFVDDVEQVGETGTTFSIKINQPRDVKVVVSNECGEDSALAVVDGTDEEVIEPENQYVCNALEEELTSNADYWLRIYSIDALFEDHEAPFGPVADPNPFLVRRFDNGAVTNYAWPTNAFNAIVGSVPVPDGLQYDPCEGEITRIIRFNSDQPGSVYSLWPKSSLEGNHQLSLAYIGSSLDAGSTGEFMRVGTQVRVLLDNPITDRITRFAPRLEVRAVSTAEGIEHHLYLFFPTRSPNELFLLNMGLPGTSPYRDDKIKLINASITFGTAYSISSNLYIPWEYDVRIFRAPEPEDPLDADLTLFEQSGTSPTEEMPYSWNPSEEPFNGLEILTEAGSPSIYRSQYFLGMGISIVTMAGLTGYNSIQTFDIDALVESFRKNTVT